MPTIRDQNARHDFGKRRFAGSVTTNDGVHLWQKLLEAGSPLGLIPTGLGARDTLRTEMKFPLYGHEIDQNTNPLEAGLGWVVKLDEAPKA